jgi:osmotically inducible lipoprotein OsmB
MTKLKITLAGAALLALAACDPAGLSPEARTVAGVAGGAAAGLIAAEALNADNNWRLIAALGGAAAGTLVAQNTQTRQCAYARGDGTFYTAPCPR